MKKGRINPLEIVNEQFVQLHERLQLAADPREKTMLRKRLRNLEEVMQFLASSCVSSEQHHALQHSL